MLAKDLLNTDFTPLSPASPVSAALAKMDAWQSSSIPVVDPATQKNVGHILFDDIADVPDETRPISDIEFRKPIFAFENQHIFEVARQMLQFEVRILSVADESERYLGIIEKKKVLESLSTMLNIATAGSVITVLMDTADFTLSKLVHLIETEGAKILGLTVEHPNNPNGMIQVSIKLTYEDTSSIISSLQRHGYLTATQNKADLMQLDLTARADELMRFLDV